MNRVWRALDDAARSSGSAHTALAGGIAVRIDDHTVFEPDALIAASDSLDDDSVFAPEPVIVVEVLSPATAMRDASIKLEDHFRVPTIAHSLIIDPDRTVAFHHRRALEKIETKIYHHGRLHSNPPGIDVEVRIFSRDYEAWC